MWQTGAQAYCLMVSIEDTDAMSSVTMSCWSLLIPFGFPAMKHEVLEVNSVFSRVATCIFEVCILSGLFAKESESFCGAHDTDLSMESMHHLRCEQPRDSVVF